MLPFERVFDSAIANGQAIVERLQDAARTRAADYHYGWRMVRDIAQIAGSGATVWALYKHKRIALPLSVATAAVTAGLTTLSACFDPRPQVDDDVDKGEKTRNRILDGIGDVTSSVIGALSIALNPPVCEALDQPMNLAPRDPLVPFTPAEHVRNVVSLYASYTLVGHWLEMLFCQLIKYGVVGGDYDRSNTMLWDWWLHPFPAEGIAGLLIAGALSPLREILLKRFGGRVLPALAVSFLVNQVVCTSIDYLTGMVANRNYELWDYREMPFNFQGQVCLQNSLVYTAAATFVTWVAYPARDAWLRRLPEDVANLGFWSFIPAYTLLSFIYFI